MLLKSKFLSQDVKDHGSDIKKIHDKISTLELGINKMKDRVIMLEVRSINGSVSLQTTKFD